MILTRKLALGVAGVVTAGVLGTAGVAAATSDTTAPTPTAASSSAPAPDSGQAKDHRTKAKHALRARGLHGEWVVKGKDGKPITLVSVRGQVTAVSATGVTVKAEDGYTATFTANGETKVRGGAEKLADVKVGAKGAVVGVKSGTTVTARVVLIHK